MLNKIPVIFLFFIPLFTSVLFAAKNGEKSNVEVLKEFELKNKSKFQVQADPKGQLYFAIQKGPKVENQRVVKGVSVAPLKKGQKSRKKTELPIIELKKIDSDPNEFEIISVIISPTEPGSEISIQANQVKIIKDGQIIDGPEFDSIGMGEGGAVREFDFSKLKNHKQIRILQWLEKESLEKFPDAKVLRKESMGDESFSVVVEEIYTWNGKGFDKKVLLEE